MKSMLKKLALWALMLCTGCGATGAGFVSGLANPYPNTYLPYQTYQTAQAAYWQNYIYQLNQLNQLQQMQNTQTFQQFLRY